MSATEILADSQAGLQHEVRLHPACQLLTSSWPAYHAYTHSTPANAGQALPQFLVHRLRWQVWVRWVPPYEYASLQALQAGCSLEKAMLVAYDHHPIDCPDAQRIEQSGALLRRWVIRPAAGGLAGYCMTALQLSKADQAASQGTCRHCIRAGKPYAARP